MRKHFCLVEEKNWWNNQKYYAINSGQGSNHGGCGKAYIMERLCEDNGITDRKKAILWDDYHGNITAAQSAGFGVIAMPNLINCTDQIGNPQNTKKRESSYILWFLM